jgi:hypothetical protein
MKSPFPGMDPWLEAPDLFPDLHAALIFLMRESLNAALPEGYAALGNYLVWTESRDARIPDVSLFGSEAVPVPSLEPHHLQGLIAIGTEVEVRKTAYLEIRADRGKRLVTAIEILSPSNKVRKSRGRKAYLKKQVELLQSGTNLVEIDLLRAGAYSSAVPRSRLRKLDSNYDYQIAAVIAGSVERYFACTLRLADRLPRIEVPLDLGVPPVPLDLQDALDRAYGSGRYESIVRYDQPPKPPLSPEQAKWAAEILAAKGVTRA